MINTPHSLARPLKHAQLRATIRSAIATGAFAPGARLPPEHR